MKAFVYTTLLATWAGLFAANAEGIPSYITAKAKQVCEKDVRKHCTMPNASYAKVRACVEKNFDKLNNDCQYEIVQMLPQIEAYEKRHNR